MALLLLGLAAATGCASDDTGRCCSVLPGNDEGLIPAPVVGDDGMAMDVIKIDPVFDCSGLTCVSYQGSRAYCTKECKDVGDCPEGFACARVLQSDPGPGSNIRPEDTFCVKVAHVCEE